MINACCIFKTKQHTLYKFPIFALMIDSLFFADKFGWIFITFCLISFIQIFYYLFFFVRLAFYKKKQKSNIQYHPVSVVICARDEAGNLTMNLPGVLIQNYPATNEVIVVNDNSFDDSKYILEAFKKSYRHMNVVELTQEAKMIPGKKFPLSVGIKSAKHEILLLTDADCVPASEHWITEMQSAYDDGTEIVLGYGAFHKQAGFLNKLIRWECYHTALQYLSYAMAGIPYMGVGRNLSYRKNIFYRHNGFTAHHHISGGDDDLFINAAANNKNTKIEISPESFTLSKAPATWKQWMRQKKRHYSTGKHYKLKHKFWLGLYSLSHLLFYPALIFSAIFFSWKLTIIPFAIRFALQWLIHGKSMGKLKEGDLIPYIFLFDLWMFVYYILFAPALVRKQMAHWK
jgi:cellulose synthase/poly-beta-1,6-N-acetylglucosamine synthase-like glycosyltransferase